MQKVTLVKADDWIALYVDGRIKCQNHRLKEKDVLEALGINFEVIECKDLEYRGLFPNNLENLTIENPEGKVNEQQNK